MLKISCEKDNTGNETDLIDYTEPIIQWDLTKDEVKEKENKTLLEDFSPDEIVFVLSYWESKGDGNLKYQGNKPFIDYVYYGFYCDELTLVSTVVIFKYNENNEKDLIEWFENKYGSDNYTIEYGYKYEGTSFVDDLNNKSYIWESGNTQIELNINPGSTLLRAFYEKNSLAKLSLNTI